MDDETLEHMAEEFPETPLLCTVITLMGYALLNLIGQLNEFLNWTGLLRSKVTKETPKNKGFNPLYKDFEAFYTRNIYRRIRDCWNRPICSLPSSHFMMMERKTTDNGWTFELTGESKRYLNLGSYNYLGFAQNEGPCAEQAIESIRKYGIAACSPRTELGTHHLHVELEKLVAEFVGKEDAIVFGMGFATNAANIPMLAGPGCLLISDELNHSSLVLGCRLSGANIQVFRHNDMAHLEEILRKAVVYGQPRKYRPWRKIIICVEGIYSMEGSIVNLIDVVRLKKKYKAYLYLDEAHSIGALGKTGRGVTELLKVDVNDVDIMMGTFTKSFGSAGGYIAATKEIITAIRNQSHANTYAVSMSPPVCQQVLASMKIIMGRDGTDDGRKRIEQLAFNAKYFREALKRMGFIVYGNNFSPIVPMMIFIPGKISEFSRLMKTLGVAVVVVGYPATPIIESRTRFCLSASHTKEDLDDALEKISEAGDILGLKYLPAQA